MGNTGGRNRLKYNTSSITTQIQEKNDEKKKMEKGVFAGMTA